MKRSLPAALILVSSAAALWAAPMPLPSTGTQEHGSISTSAKDGAFRWKADWVMNVAEEGGKKVMRFTETGEGYKSEFGQKISWKLLGLWSLDGHVSPISFDEEVKDAKGQVIQVEKKSFNPAGGVLKIETKKPQKNSDKTKELKIPSDVLATEGIGTALRGLPFDPPQAFTTHLVADDKKLYEVTLEPRGIERIKNAGGEFDCYKVELVPNLGLLGVFKVFVPKTYFWFTVAKPHFLVRYEGLESGLGTPHVVLDVVKFETLAQ